MNIQNLSSYDPFADLGDESKPDATSQATKKQQTQNYVHIRIQQRNGRKTLTTLQGLPKEYDQKKLLKAFKKEFACNGTIVDDEELGQVIQLQGDQRQKVASFIVQEGITPKADVKSAEHLVQSPHYQRLVISTTTTTTKLHHDIDLDPTLDATPIPTSPSNFSSPMSAAFGEAGPSRLAVATPLPRCEGGRGRGRSAVRRRACVDMYAVEDDVRATGVGSRSREGGSGSEGASPFGAAVPEAAAARRLCASSLLALASQMVRPPESNLSPP